MSEAKSPSFAFSGGMLHVNVPRSQMRLQWKPKPHAEELYVGHRKWRALWPEFRILRPPENQKRKPARAVEIQMEASARELARQKAEALGAFREEIEPEIVRIAEPFGSHQWALMTFMQGDEWATELARGNPVLAYALANNSLFRGTPTDAAAVQARWHCHRKQRELLEWLGLPSSEPFVKLLRKIPAESVSPSILRRMGFAMKSDNRVLEYLSHVPAINSAVLEMATTVKYLDLLTPKLLAEVSESTETPGEDSVGDMILGGMTIMEKTAPNQRIKPFSSIQQIRRFRDRADAEFLAHMQRLEVARQEAIAAAGRERRRYAAEAARQRKLDAQPFPYPPIPGTDSIIPLTDSEQLVQEGRELVNCVSAYAPAIRCGSLFIYKVLKPERATLSIMRGSHGCWRLRELKTFQNARVQDRTLRHVQAWLETFHLSL